MTDLSEKSIDSIARLIAHRIDQQKKEESILLSRSQINALCGFGKNSSVVRKWTADPTFPKPCKRSGVARWFRKDVMEWLRGEPNLA